MSIGGSRTTGWRPGLRLTALLMVFAGAFGMHGLDGHDGVAIGRDPQAATAAMAGTPDAMNRGSGRGQPGVEAAGVSDTGDMHVGMAAVWSLTHRHSSLCRSCAADQPGPPSGRFQRRCDRIRQTTQETDP